MEFIETSIFTKRVGNLLTDDEYRGLQEAVFHDPLAGDVIPGGHGLRKMRWSLKRKGIGKRGGVRIIYYCLSRERIYLIFIYTKAKEGDLTKDQLKALSVYVRGGVL